MGNDNILLGGNPVIDQRPIQGGVGNMMLHAKDTPVIQEYIQALKLFPVVYQNSHLLELEKGLANFFTINAVWSRQQQKCRNFQK